MGLPYCSRFSADGTGDAAHLPRCVGWVEVLAYLLPVQFETNKIARSKLLLLRVLTCAYVRACLHIHMCVSVRAYFCLRVFM